MDRAIGNNGDRFNLLGECCNQFVDLGQRWIRSRFNSVCMCECLQCFKKIMNWHDIPSPPPSLPPPPPYFLGNISMINANFVCIRWFSFALLKLYFSLNFTCVLDSHTFDLFKEHYSTRFSINRSQHSSKYNDDLRIEILKWSLWIITTLYVFYIRNS